MHLSSSVFRHRPYVLWICCGLLLSGCGARRPETALVTGRVTFGGKAVASGRVVFDPADGKHPAQGVIEPDGRYTLTTFNSGDGALLGKHQVTIRVTRPVGPLTATSPPNPQGNANLSPRAKMMQVESVSHQPHLEWLVPEKYARQGTTPLRAEVKRGANTINFDLP